MERFKDRMPVRQSAPAASFQRLTPSGINSPVEGTVIGIHYPGDSTNQSKREIEYDVQTDIANLGIIYNAPLGLGDHSMVGDDEMILKPAEFKIPSGSFSAYQHGSAADTDGDRVLVQFVNGSLFAPVITHVISHRQRGFTGDVPTRYKGKLEILSPGPVGEAGYEFGDGTTGSTEADTAARMGDRKRHYNLNGTHVLVDNRGDMFVNFKEHPNPDKQIPAGDVAKKMVIQNEGRDLFRVDIASGGALSVVLGELFAGNILVQMGDGAKSVTIAEYLETLYNNMKTAVEAWGDPSTGHAHTAPSGGTSPPTAPVTLPSWDSNIASTKITIPDG